MKKALSLAILVALVFCTIVLVSCDLEKLAHKTNTTTTGNIVELPDENPNEIHEHVFGDWEVIIEKTLFKEGLNVRYCECGEKEEMYVHAGSEGIIYSLNSGGQSYSVKGRKNDSDNELIIPETYRGLPVTGVLYKAFFYDHDLVSVTFSDSVVNIGAQSFYFCDSLQSITFGNNLNTIGADAFAHCKSVKNVTLPDSLTSIGDSVFYSCSSLESITFGNNLNTIDDNAFTHCVMLKNIIIPDTVTSIGKSAFSGCSSLMCIYIPSSVVSIGEKAFFGCSLSAIEVDEANEKFKDVEGVLYSKDGTILINYPKAIKGSTFTVPEGVTEISAYAFVNCLGLKLIEIPDGVTHIGEEAFISCGIESIYIPKSVVSIGDSVFMSCRNLTSIDVDADNEYYKTIDGNLYTKDGTILIKYNSNKKDTVFVVPNYVTAIADDAFRDSKYLESVIISDSVSYIGGGAFAECSSLKEIKLSSSLIKIGSFAFSYCDSLISVVIPEGTICIEQYAFAYCTSLERVVIPKSVETIEHLVFEKCSSLTIYCRALKSAWGWNPYWNDFRCPVVWGYTGE